MKSIIFDNESIKYITNKLHDDYKNCNIKVLDKWGILRFVFNEKPYKFPKNIVSIYLMLRYKPMGVFSKDTKNVYVFPKNVMSTMNGRLSFNEECFSTLFHELRHYWQDKKGKYEKWDVDMIEKDAQKFEFRMVEKLLKQ